jgi:hypothetical protein
MAYCPQSTIRHETPALVDNLITATEQVLDLSREIATRRSSADGRGENDLVATLDESVKESLVRSPSFSHGFVARPPPRESSGRVIGEGHFASHSMISCRRCRGHRSRSSVSRISEIL